MTKAMEAINRMQRFPFENHFVSIVLDSICDLCKNSIMCFCDLCNALVGGPPAGAEDYEGFNIGVQALGNLLSICRVTACHVPNLLLLTFKHDGSAAPATEAWVSGNSS
jgi:hypothetical protein